MGLSPQGMILSLICINPAEAIYLNFQPLEVVDRGTSSG